MTLLSIVQGAADIRLRVEGLTNLLQDVHPATEKAAA